MRKQTSLVLAFILMILFVIFFGFSFLTKIDSNKINPADLHLAQYSDQNITENAKIKDPKFEKIAFAPAPVLEKNSLSQLASVASIFKTLFAERPRREKEEYGTWLWTPTLQMTENYMDFVISGAKERGVNAIYLSIDSYLDIFAMREGPEKKEKKKLFEKKLEQFISKAGKEGIAVDAEAGWRNWAETGHTYKPFAIVSFVSGFNATSPYKFRGFQYDVEPYLLDEYKTDQAGVLKNFTQLVDDTAFFLRDKNIKFSVVVPDFWDKRDESTDKFEYKNKSDYVLGHLFHILDQNKESDIILMSYRNFAEGKDGSIEISKNEMRSAKWGFHSTGVIIAQESGDVPPSYITFYNTPVSYFKTQTALLHSAFSSHPNFTGLAIHYANAFFELR